MTKSRPDTFPNLTVLKCFRRMLPQLYSFRSIKRIDASLSKTRALHEMSSESLANHMPPDGS